MITIRRHVPTAARLFLGLVFTAFGLNFFLHFIPMPPPPPKALPVFGALMGTGWVMPLAHVTEVVGGVLLLSGLFVPLALTLLAPVIVNILAFHALVTPAGLGIPLAVLAAEIVLARAHRASFAPMLRARAPRTEVRQPQPAARELRAAA